MMETNFASAEKIERRKFKNQIYNISHNPIMTTLLKTMSGLLVILNEDRRIVSMNHAFLEAIGISDPEEILGLRLGESLSCVHAHEDPDGCGTTPYCVTCGAAIAMLAAIEEDRPDEQICALTSEKDGRKSDMSLLVKSQPIRVDGYRWILIFAQDITKQQYWLNMEHIFFHDINNILTVLKGITYLHFANLAEDDESKRILDVLERLCDEIALQKSLAQHKDIKYIPRRSRATIDEIRRHLDLFIRNHKSLRNKSINERWPEINLTVNTDKLLVSRVLGNMLINALEATQEGGSVSLNAKIEPDCIVWEVWNNAFIDEDIQKRVFQRHFSTKSDPGRGLGTYSMKLFGEDYLNGKVSFQSSRESGTTFMFRLPRQ